VLGRLGVASLEVVAKEGGPVIDRETEGIDAEGESSSTSAPFLGRQGSEAGFRRHEERAELVLGGARQALDLGAGQGAVLATTGTLKAEGGEILERDADLLEPGAAVSRIVPAQRAKRTRRRRGTLKLPWKVGGAREN
jgi:hypothetical protein